MLSSPKNIYYLKSHLCYPTKTDFQRLETSKTQTQDLFIKVRNCLAPLATTKSNPNMLDPSSIPTFDYVYKKAAIFKKEAPGHGELGELGPRNPDPCRSQT